MGPTHFGSNCLFAFKYDTAQSAHPKCQTMATDFSTAQASVSFFLLKPFINGGLTG
jgi:hypothetical protein